MTKTVLLTKEQQRKLQKKFSIYGTISECIQKTGLDRNTIRRAYEVGKCSETTKHKLESYLGYKLDLKED
jgi:hypothetical protein